MDERLKFVARLLDGEKMAVLCREFDISRKTGYKIFARYKDCGLEGLTDRSRQPYRHGLRLPFQIEKLIVQLKLVATRAQALLWPWVHLIATGIARGLNACASIEFSAPMS
jgi:hypothetical protein